MPRPTSARDQAPPPRSAPSRPAQHWALRRPMPARTARRGTRTDRARCTHRVRSSCARRPPPHSARPSTQRSTRTGPGRRSAPCRIQAHRWAHRTRFRRSRRRKRMCLRLRRPRGTCRATSSEQGTRRSSNRRHSSRRSTRTRQATHSGRAASTTLDRAAVRTSGRPSHRRTGTRPARCSCRAPSSRH